MHCSRVWKNKFILKEKKKLYGQEQFWNSRIKNISYKVLNCINFSQTFPGKCRLYKSPKEKILWNNYLADELFFANFLKELGSRRTHSGKHRRLMGPLLVSRHHGKQGAQLSLDLRPLAYRQDHRPWFDLAETTYLAQSDFILCQCLPQYVRQWKMGGWNKPCSW